MLDHVGVPVSDFEQSKRFSTRKPSPRLATSYYGAFVLDPDGNNIEAVCHEPAEEA